MGTLHWGRSHRDVGDQVTKQFYCEAALCRPFSGRTAAGIVLFLHPLCPMQPAC